MTASDPVHGVPRTEDVDAKRGFFYQDVATALAWLDLAPDEVLHIEVAEDYARQRADGLETVQVRHTQASLTLLGALDTIERYLALRECNPSLNLTFVYQTTSPIGTEQRQAHRPAGAPGIAYWNDVRMGKHPAAPLVRILRELAPSSSRLAAYLSDRSDTDVERDLLHSMAWATHEVGYIARWNHYQERLAELTHREFGTHWSDATHVAEALMTRLVRISLDGHRDARRVTAASLRMELAAITQVTLTPRAYDTLLSEAALARNLPTQPVEEDVRERLIRMRRTRFFPEAQAPLLARELARDVGASGSCAIVDPLLRADALAWSARLLLDSDPDVANSLLLEARHLALTPTVARVEAMAQLAQDPAAARQALLGMDDAETNTVRYWMQRRPRPTEALSWLQASELQPHELDADGALFVLTDLGSTADWERGERWLEALSLDAYAACPALILAAAYTSVALAMPPTLRRVPRGEPPLVGELPLMDTSAALRWRQRAADAFRLFHDVARGEGLPRVADIAMRFHLWLRLQSRSTRTAAAAQVLESWNTVESSERVYWLPLAMAAEVPIDHHEWTHALDRQAARQGAFTDAEASARMVLVLNAAPADGLGHWPRLLPLLKPHFDAGFLAGWEVEALAMTGRMVEATAALERATELNLAVAALLRTKIEDGSEVLDLSTWQEDDTPAALRLRLAVLRKHGRPEATSCAQRLFEVTQDHEDLFEWLRLLGKAKEWATLVRAVDANRHMLELSDQVASVALDAWTHVGRWEDARALVSLRPDLVAQPLEFLAQLAVYSGEWERLGALIEQARTDELPVTTLRQFSRLAVSTGRVDAARSLMARAVGAAPDDAVVLWDAYQLAVRGRWESSPEVADWLQRAIEGSGTSGPLQRRPLADIVEFTRQSAERHASMSRGVASAALPIGAIARALRRPLSTVFLQGPINNERQNDPSQRAAISAFAARKATDLSAVDHVALDQSALLTLARLDLLTDVLAAFARISVTEGVGAWLFFEHAETHFHQPSRVEDARALLTLLATEVFKVISDSTPYSRRVALEVGEPLAQLIHLASRDGAEGKDAFVVRPAPLHRAGSLTEEFATLGEEMTLLRSCTAIARSLHADGLISDADRDRALALFGQEDHYVHDEEVRGGATLYLDDLAVTYFQSLNLWRPLRDAGYRLFVHPEVRAEAQALVAGEASLALATEILTRVRTFLVEAQVVGKLGFLSRAPEDSDHDELPPFSVLDALGATHGIQAVIVDDRSINRYEQLTCDDGTRVVVASSLDLLDRLRTQGRLDETSWTQHRSRLRRGGLVFVPVTAEELLDATSTSRVRDGVLIESPAARTIRENLLLSASSEMLRAPDEIRWVLDFNHAIIDAVGRLWRLNDGDDTRVRAQWLVSLRRWDGFIGQMPGEWDGSRIRHFEALHLSQLVLTRSLPSGRQRAFAAWLDDQVLLPVRESRPAVFSLLLGQVTESLRSIPDTVAPEALALSPQAHADTMALVTRSLINELPTSLRQRIVEDPVLLARLELGRTMTVPLPEGNAATFRLNELAQAAQTCMSTGTPAPVRDTGGAEWECVAHDVSEVTVSEVSSSRHFRLPHAALYHPAADVRLGYLREWCHRAGFPVEDVAELERLTTAPLRGERVTAVERDMRMTPRVEHARLVALFQRSRFALIDVINLDDAYLRRLAPPVSVGESLEHYIERLTERALNTDAQQQVHHELVWSSHPRTTPRRAVASLAPETLRTAVASWLPLLDLWSLTGLIESTLQRDDVHTQVHDVVHQLVQAFVERLSDDVRVGLASSLVAFVDYQLQVSGVLDGRPVFARRLVAVAHAALVERAAIEAGLNLEELRDILQQFFAAFSWSTLADLPSDPRWGPHMLGEAQLAHELRGRVVTALQPHREELVALHDGTEFGDLIHTLTESYKFFFSAVPGPLEGALVASEVPDDWVSDALRLAADEGHLVNPRIASLAHLYRLGTVPAQVDAVLSTLVNRKSLEPASEEDAELEHVLMATLDAAVCSGSPILADAVRALLDSRVNLPKPARLYFELALCGRVRSRHDWVDAVTPLIRRFAARPQSRSDAQYVLARMTELCDAQPMLRSRIASAVCQIESAALRAGE